MFSLQCEHRVSWTDEESVQVSSSDGGSQHPQCAAAAGTSGRSPRKDPESPWRIPGEGKGLFPKVGRNWLGQALSLCRIRQENITIIDVQSVNWWARLKIICGTIGKSLFDQQGSYLEYKLIITHLKVVYLLIVVAILSYFQVLLCWWWGLARDHW